MLSCTTSNYGNLNRTKGTVLVNDTTCFLVDMIFCVEKLMYLYELFIRFGVWISGNSPVELQVWNSDLLLVLLITNF